MMDMELVERDPSGSFSGHFGLHLFDAEDDRGRKISVHATKGNYFTVWVGDDHYRVPFAAFVKEVLEYEAFVATVRGIEERRRDREREGSS